MKIIICVLVVTLCAVAALSGCGEKPLTYNPPPLFKDPVYGSYVVYGQVMGTHVYKDREEVDREVVGHQKPLFTTLELSGNEKSIYLCGDQRGAFKLLSRVTIVLEDSPRSDYDGCYSGWK